MLREPELMNIVISCINNNFRLNLIEKSNLSVCLEKNTHSSLKI